MSKSDKSDKIENVNIRSLFVVDETDTIKVTHDFMFNDEKQVLGRDDIDKENTEKYVKIVAEFKRGTYKDTTTLFGKHFKVGGASSSLDIDVFTLTFDRLKLLLRRATVTHMGDSLDLSPLDLDTTSDAVTSALIGMMNDAQPFDLGTYAEYITSSISTPGA